MEQSQKYFDPNSNYYDVKVVGVTYRNDDGTLRQEILRQLSDLQRSGSPISVSLESYSYNGSPAYAVILNGSRVGNLSEDLACKVRNQIDSGFDLCDLSASIYGGPRANEPDRSFGCSIQFRLSRDRNPFRALVSRKKRLTAFLLCFFLGFIGAHRFYARRTKGGILFLFTCGLFFFGVIYDLILILLGKFYDSKGNVI